MSRTEDLKGSGARQVSGGGNNAPFVKWTDSYGYIEGVIQSFWETKYGDAATMEVTGVKNVQAKAGSDEPPMNVEEGQTVNVGLQYSALSGVDEGLAGHEVHIAFEGWEKSKQGNRYRVFSVLDMGETETADTGDETEAPSGVGAGPGAPGAEGPPPPGDDGELPF